MDRILKKPYEFHEEAIYEYKLKYGDFIDREKDQQINTLAIIKCLERIVDHLNSDR